LPLRLFIISAILFVCSGISAVAQHPYFYTVNDDVGLPSNEVYDIDQDEFGYMWVGSNAGLFRYDGFRFEQFKNANQNAVAISSLSFSGDKRLFSQNFFGQIFYAQKDSLIIFADVKDKIKSHPEFTIDSKNNVWIGLPNGILIYYNNGSKKNLFKDQIVVTEIETTSDDSIYVIDNQGGLFLIEEKQPGQYTKTGISDPEKVLKNNRCIFKKQQGRLFVISSNNIGYTHNICEISEGTIKTIKKINVRTFAEFVYTIALINNRIWLGTSSGAYLLSSDGIETNHYFPKEKISDIFRDREGTYWFSSLQNGLYAVPHMELMFLNTSNSPLTDNNITALKNFNGSDMLAGTYTGDIYQYNRLLQVLRPLPKNKKSLYRNVTTIIPFNNNTVLAGRGGISVINMPDSKEDHYPSVYIRDMAMVGDSILYTSTQSISAISNIPDLVSNKKYHTNIIKSVSGKKIAFDRVENIVWVTLNEGLAYLHNNDFIPYLIHGKPAFCNTLHSDDNGLWAGTVSDGVYNIRKGKVTLHLNNDNGLSGNNIKCITSSNDTLYIATDECINIRYPDGRFSYIKHADGINAKEINAMSITGNYIYVGTIRGLFYVPVNTNFRNLVRPNIKVTAILSDGKKLEDFKSIALTYNNKDILINFSATALRSRGRFNYLYRIKGIKNEWEKLTGNINYVRLSHLPAGSFIFEVKAVNEDNISSGIATCAIHVAAPFWQNWWFYLLIVLIAASVVAILFQIRIKTIKRKADIRNQLTNSQLTTLKAQMNPHFMYNTLNSIQDLVLQNDIKNSNYYLSRYSSLMRKILDASENDEIELAEEADTLQLYLELEQLRFGNDFTFNILIAPHIDKHSIHIPSMIIQPFVENAIKHGLLHKKGKKQVDISFSLSNNILKCSITDNGVGRARSAAIKSRSPQPHRSFATRATEKRLELINLNRQKKLKLVINDLMADGLSTGTEVLLDIPLS
jgi:ligand-binding sensor domain-containing protein